MKIAAGKHVKIAIMEKLLEGTELEGRARELGVTSAVISYSKAQVVVSGVRRTTSCSAVLSRLNERSASHGCGGLLLFQQLPHS